METMGKEVEGDGGRVKRGREVREGRTAGRRVGRGRDGRGRLEGGDLEEDV